MSSTVMRRGDCSPYAAIRLRVAAPMANLSSAVDGRRAKAPSAHSLRLRDVLKASRGGPEQLEESRKRDLRFGLDASSTEDVHAAGPPVA